MAIYTVISGIQNVDIIFSARCAFWNNLHRVR